MYKHQNTFILRKIENCLYLFINITLSIKKFVNREFAKFKAQKPKNK